MNDYLTPAELDEWADELERTYPPDNKLAPTLRAYANLVEEIAKIDPPIPQYYEDNCQYCGCWAHGEEHRSDCLWKRARELAGKE